jgi:4'-phosphopantetheinyl transferase
MSTPVTHGETWAAIPLPLELSTDLVHVVRFPLDLPVEQWTSLNKFLTDDERDRAARFRVNSPRQQFVICRATLRRLLSSLCGIEPKQIPLICENHGKPRVTNATLGRSGPEIEFNVSHSGHFGLIALTLESPVGIDVEEHNSDVQMLKVAERFFAPEETAALHKLSPEKQLAGFYRGWTCKEAYIKAKGAGLSLSLCSFCVEIDPDCPASLLRINDQPHEPAKWTTQSLEIGQNYAAAVMVARPNCQIECWNWHESP